jgi:PAS domain S-box-containing protein
MPDVKETAGPVLPGERKHPLEGFIGFTERDRTEEVLRESEERYRLLFEISTNAVMIRDREGIIRLANPTAFSMLKASRPDEIVGKAYLDFVHPEDRPGSIVRIQRQINAAKGEPGIDPACKVASLREHRLVTLNGETIYVESTGVAFWHHGQIWIQGNFHDITQRKRAEEALREREERYRSILEGMEEGYFEVDLKGKFTVFNDSLRNMLGFSKSEMIGMSYKKYTDEETARKIYETFNKVYNSDKPVKTFEWEITRRDGKKAFLESSVYAIRNAQSERTGFRGIVRDVTEREKMEEALRRSEEAANRLAKENAIIAEISRIISSTLNIEEVYERFGEEVRNLIPFERIAINLIDAKNYTFSITYVLGSQAPYRQLGDVFPLAGTAAEQILKTRSSLFIQVKNRDEVAARYPGLFPILDAGYQSIIMVPLIAKNEVIGVFNIQSKEADSYDEMDLKLIERVSMQISGAIANAHLFAERRRALEQFMRSEERSRNLVERSPDMILLCKKEELVYVNPAAVRALGASRPEDLIGKSVLEIIQPEYWNVARDRVLKVGERTEVSLLEEKFIRLDGKSVDVEVMASTIFYEEQPMIQIVARDITERRDAAEKMAALQTQLFQSQKMEAIGQLAGGFAHDFNNSLTLIKTCTQLTLLELKKDDPLRKKIEMINDAVDRSASLSRHLLAFSRRQVMEVKVLDLNNVLRDLDKMLRRVIGEDIALINVYAQDLGRVKADPVQIEQVILNLVINARDAMPKGGRLIIETSDIELGGNYAHAHVKMVPGRYVLLTVSDTGVGMTPEVKERVFEPFFTTKPRGKGTGLGLSTAYGIVKQSGGYIWVYSEPGVGTTFKIYLPRVEEPMDEEKGKRLPQELPCGGETLLLVEDEKDFRLVVGKALKKQGYKILEASNGGEALLICKEQKDPIHLMLTDVVMPDMSGPQLAQRLRLIHPAMKVLHMSGYAHDAITHHGILEKGINFIQKPFSIEKLSEKVREVLNN